MDAEILVAIPEPGRLDLLSPIYAFCRERGYVPDGDAIGVGERPVQFIPAFSELTVDTIRNAETGDIDGVPLRVVKADYLALFALSVGRAKDLTRILALREAEAAIDEQILELAGRRTFTTPTDRKDPPRRQPQGGFKFQRLLIAFRNSSIALNGSISHPGGFALKYS